MSTQITTKHLPADSAWLFPEYEFAQMNLQQYHGIIIERILERGSWEQLRWLFHTFIADFYLAGGTALALQLGHRVSMDLDWFSTSRLLFAPEREAISQVLSASAQFIIISEQDGMIFTRLLETDVSFIHQQHALLEPTVDYHGIPLASPADIGLMKLAAVNSRGSRRDFIDLYCLRDIVSLERLLELATTKYAD